MLFEDNMKKRLFKLKNGPVGPWRIGESLCGRMSLASKPRDAAEVLKYFARLKKGMRFAMFSLKRNGVTVTP